MSVPRQPTARFDDAGEPAEVRRSDLLATRVGPAHGARIDSATGFLHGVVRPTRTGVFKYVRLDGSISYELKHPDDVFDDASLETLKRITLTEGHPRDAQGRPYMVTADNVDRLQVGQGGDTIGREKADDEEHPTLGVTVTRRRTVQRIVDDKKDQVSLGYTTVLVPETGVYKGQRYNARHTKIRYNHLAMALDAGRGGKTVNFLLDEADAADEALFAASERREDDQPMHEIVINGVTIKVDGPAAGKLIQDAIAAEKAKTDAAAAEKEAAEAERDALQAKVDAAEKEAEETKKKADEAPSFAKRFREVHALRADCVTVIGKIEDEGKAKTVVDALDKAVEAEKPATAMKRIALEARGDELKDKSDAYVDALWDIRLKDAKEAEEKADEDEDSTQVVGAGLLGGAGKPDASEQKKADEALKNAIRVDDPLTRLAKAGTKGLMTVRTEA